MQQFCNCVVLLFVGCPLARVNVQVINLKQKFLREFSSFRDDVGANHILNTLRHLTVHNREEFVNQTGLEFAQTLLTLFLNLLQKRFLCCFQFLVLNQTREEFLVNHNTCQ